MAHVVFVVPFALDTTMRFVRAAAALPGVRLGIVSREPVSRMPRELLEQVSGYEVVQDALEPDQIEQAVRRLGRQWGGRVDRLIGVLEQLQEPLAVVRERLGLPGMPVEVAKNFRDKSRMKDVLRAHGIPCARHALAGTTKQALDFAEDCGYPLVVKPPAGAGAKNTVRVEERSQLESYLRTLPPKPSDPVLLEEFILGKEHSFDSVSLGGRHVFHSVSRYYPTPLEVMEAPWIQWCVLLPRHIDGPEFAAIHDVGPRALTALGMGTGLTHMEWFRRDDDSIAVSEVAARPPGAQFTTLLSHAYDRDFYAAWARLACLHEFQAPERRYAAGAVFLRGQGQGRVVGVEGLKTARDELGSLVVEAKLPRLGQVAASSYEGEGFVILRHPETSAVEDGLRRLLSLVQVQLG